MGRAAVNERGIGGHHRPRGAARWGWGMNIGIAGLLLVNGAALYAFIEEAQEDRTIGVLLAVLGALALSVAIDGWRRGSVPAWRSMWVLVVGLAAIGAHTFGSGRLDIPLFYLGMAAVTLVGQLLAGRDLDR